MTLAGMGVLTFSFTFPATQRAVVDFNPWMVGVGRAVIASLLAGVCLLAVRARFPERRHTRSLLIVGVGVVLGFPVFTALALEGTTSAHAAVIIGLIPLATAIFGRLRGNERPGALFWWASAAGATVVTAYAFRHGFSGFGIWDVFLVCALVTGGLGYAEGGLLSRELPGWKVISWGLVLSLPASIPISVIAAIADPPDHVGTTSLIGFAYVSVFSMFLGFCAWYPGLARVGVTKGSQVQLLQPLLTVVWAAVLLGDAVDTATVMAAFLVLICVGVAQWARLSTAPDKRRDKRVMTGATAKRL
jgi:drug/metabolite transporter (DMT)-like permease